MRRARNFWSRRPDERFADARETVAITLVPLSNPFAPDAPAFASNSLNQRHAGEGDVPLAESFRAGAGAIRCVVIEYDYPPRDGGFVR